MGTFNLVESRWIPVIGSRGPESVGLGEALVRSQEIRLGFADKMQEVAVFRFLLAIAIDTLGLPRDESDWERRWRAGSFDSDALADYLSQVGDRFDLLGPRPAFQVGDLAALSGELKPSSLLVPAVATGNNVPLFSVRLQTDPPRLDLAEAAVAILATHAWDTAAIKTGAVGDPRATAGKTTGNPTGPLGQLGVVIPTGPTLFDTLLLNTPITGLVGALGTPWWRRAPESAEWQERHPDGLLDLLTWQSRRIRIFPEEGPAGNPVVRNVLVCAGDRLASVPAALEIHTVWKAVEKPKAGQPGSRPVRHQPGRALWRGMAGLLAIRGASGTEGLQTARVLQQVAELGEGVLGEDFPLGLLAVGVTYGNQSAVIENVYVDEIPLPIDAFGVDSAVAQTVRECAEQADRLRMALNNLADNVRRACGADAIPWDKSQRPGDRMVAEFDPVVRRVLATLQRDGARAEAVLIAWQESARAIALRSGEPVVASAASNGFLGRGDGRAFISVPLADNFYRGSVRKILGEPQELEVSA